MTIVKRTITNTGHALTVQDGTILSGIEVSFLLVNQDNRPTDAWDIVSGERIAPIKEVATTSETGFFSVSLWPTDRTSSDTPRFYRCTTKSPDVHSFVVP